MQQTQFMLPAAQRVSVFDIISDWSVSRPPGFKSIHSRA